ncbi:hypothetical protein BH23BAC3_BH23BAC3_14320 [soil metagenome]
MRFRRKDGNLVRKTDGRRDGGDAAWGLRIFNEVQVGAGPFRSLLAVEL